MVKYLAIGYKAVSVDTGIPTHESGFLTINFNKLSLCEKLSLSKGRKPTNSSEDNFPGTTDSYIH